MRTGLFNVQVLEASGRAPYPGAVLIEDDRIAAVAETSQPQAWSVDRSIDGKGGTLMPGLIEAHAHIGYTTSTARAYPQIYAPPAEHAFITAHNARTLLEAGFTGAYSAGAMKPDIEVALKAEIDGGWLPGPRFIPASAEGFMPDDPDAKVPPTDAASMVAWVERSADLGCKVIKLLLSGLNMLWPGYGGKTMYGDETLEAARAVVERRGLWLSAHIMNLETCKQALRHGFRVLYHCDELDEEALDMMEARREHIFVAPTVGGIGAYDALRRRDPEAARTLPFADHHDKLELYQRNIAAMRARGVRLLPGGDYGFPFTPIGRNAQDICYFVHHFGFTPAEAIESATRLGGQLMDMPIGCVAPGLLADLLLIDGDPLADIDLLADPSSMRMIMKGGAIHRLAHDVPVMGAAQMVHGMAA